jgi:hypothetical protein
MGVTVGRRSAAGSSMLQRSMQKHMQHRKRKTRIVRMSNKSMRRRRPQMQVVALLTLPKGADCMPIAPAVSGNDQVEDRQLQRKLRISMLHGWPTPTEQQAAGGTSRRRPHLDTMKYSLKNSPKTAFFREERGLNFFAGLPPRTPVRTHTPVSRYSSPTPRAAAPAGGCTAVRPYCSTT